jgi:uncharacterized protein YkwD
MRLACVTVASIFALVVQVGTASAAGVDQAAYAQRVLELTNAERERAGLGPLLLSTQLNEAAQRYTEVLASGDCFAHTCGPVPEFSVRIRDTGYAGSRMLAENIAAGYPTPDAVVAGWMSSAGHRQNILTPAFTEMGLGVATGAGKFGTYWTQEFGARPVAAAPAAVAEQAAVAVPEGGDVVPEEADGSDAE